jgi:hypothetical protein
MPTGRAIGQTVLGDEADGEVLDAGGVLALGCGQVGHVGAEAEAAVGALVLGIGNDQIDGATSQDIAQIVQGAAGAATASGTLAAARAGSAGVVAAAPHHLGLG